MSCVQFLLFVHKVLVVTPGHLADLRKQNTPGTLHIQMLAEALQELLLGLGHSNHIGRWRMVAGRWQQPRKNICIIACARVIL